MKNILSLLIITACIFLAQSCKEKTGNPPENQVETPKPKKVTVEPMSGSMDSDSLMVTIKNMSKIDPAEIQSMNEDAELIINHRYKETDRKSFIILDKDLWEYEFIFSGKRMSSVNQFEGYWIDFAEELTYTYGHYQDVLGSGRYTYSVSSGLLLLIDDNKSIKPQEFEAKLFDKTLVMDGNEIYKDNNYNAKLKRITERPSKSN